MATEADFPEPVSLAENDGVNRHSTPGEFNQPTETAFLLKPENMEVSSHVETSVSGFEGKAGVIVGGSFFESPIIAKVSGEETHAVGMPYQAEKKMPESEKFKATEEKETKKNEVIGEMKERAEKGETSCELSDATGISLNMDKNEEPCLRIGEENSEERISDHVEENPKTIEKETTGFQKDVEDGPKENEDVELKTSKEASIVKASSGQNGETSIHIPDLMVHHLETEVEPGTEACPKNENNDNAWSTETATTEEKTGEKTSEGVQEKKEERCSSSFDEDKVPHVDESIEKIGSEQEGIKRDATEETSQTLSESIDIIENDGEASYPSIKSAENKLESPALTLATDRSRMQEDDTLKVGETVEETSSIEIREENLDNINLNENKKDMTAIIDEPQEKDHVDIPSSVTQTEEVFLQKEDEIQVSNAVQENWSDVVKNIPQKKGQIEIPEKAQADSSEGENVKEETTSDQKLDNLLVNKEGKQNIDEQLAVTEKSTEESRHCIRHTVIADEDINEALTAPAHSNVEPGNEEIKAIMEIASEEIQTTATVECSETIACAKEDASIKNEEEMCLQKVDEIQVSSVVQENWKEDVKMIPQEGLIEISEKAQDNSSEDENVKDETTPEQKLANHKEGKQNINEQLAVTEPSAEESRYNTGHTVIAAEDINEALTAPGHCQKEPGNEEIKASFKMAFEEIETTGSGEFSETIACGKQDTSIKKEGESFEKKEEEKKTMDIDAISEDRILEQENLQTELNEKTEITEVEILNKSVNELTATHSLEKKTGQLEDSELGPVSEFEPEEAQGKEEEKSVDIDPIRDDGIPKVENPPPTEVNGKNEIAEIEIQNKSIDELKTTHSLKEETGSVKSKELGGISDFEPQYQVEEEKSVVIDANRDDGIPKVENLPPTEVNEKIDLTEVEIPKKSIDEFSLTHSMEQETLPVEGDELREVSDSKPQDKVKEANGAGKNEENNDENNSNACESIENTYLELPCAEGTGTTGPSSETSERKIEKLEEAHDYDYKEKLEIKDVQTSIEGYIRKKEEACETETHKSATSDDTEKCHIEEENSEKICSAPFLHNTVEQKCQAASLSEAVITLKGEGEEGEKTRSIKNEEITGIAEINDEQNQNGNVIHLPSEEVINEEAVQSSAETAREVNISTGQDTVGQITERNNIEDISQESVEECTVKNFQNDEKDIDKSSTTEESETAKIVDNIANEAKPNDERPNPTLQCSLVNEEIMQSEDQVSHEVSSADKTVGDGSSLKKDEYKENYTEETEVEEHNEEKHEENSQKILQENEPQENIEQSMNVISKETEAGALNKMDNTVEETLESPQDIEKEAEMATEEITNECNIKSLSQQSVAQDQIKNFQNDDNGAEKSKTEKFEEPKTAETGKCSAHETNQNDKSLRTGPTSVAKEVKIQVEDKNIQAEASLEEKKDEHSSFNMNEENDSHAMIEEDSKNSDVQNGRNAGLEELKEQSEKTLKSEEDSEQILENIEPGENLEQPITVPSTATEAVTQIEVANNTEEEIFEYSQENVEAEMHKKEYDTKGHIIDECDMESLSKESSEQGILKNFHRDESAEVCNQEIFKEFLTSEKIKSIALDINENNESPNATYPTAPMKEEESLHGKVENTNPTEVLPEDTMEDNGSLIQASQDNDNNTESAEAVKDIEKERSRGEENREPEWQKNETEEPPESSNIIIAENETGTLREKGNDIIIAKEHEAIQNTEEPVLCDNEEGYEDIEDEVQNIPTREYLKPEAKTCNTDINVESEAKDVETNPMTSEIEKEDKHTSNNREEEIKKEEIEEVYNDTKTACLNEDNKSYNTIEAHTTRDIRPQSTGGETDLVNKEQKEEEKPKMEMQEELEPTSIDKDTKKIVLEELNVIKDQSIEPAIVTADDMIGVEPKKEMHEITQSAEDEDIGKQIIEESSVTEDNFDVPVRGTDGEYPTQKQKEDGSDIMKSKEEIKSFNSEPTEQIASRGYEVTNQFNDTECKQEPNIGLCPVKESEEGMLHKESNESLVEVFFLESQSKEDPLLKEEPHVNDSNPGSIKEVTKETSFEGVEFELEAKRQFESSGSYTQEKGPVSVNAKGTTLDLNSIDINAPRDDASTLVEKRDHELPHEADEAEDIKHAILNDTLIAGSDIQNEMIVTATFSGKISDDNLMECSKMSTNDSELITSEESMPVVENLAKHPTAHENVEIALVSQETETMHNKDKITALEEVAGLGLLDTGIENTNEEDRSYQSEDLLQKLELHYEQVISKPEESETLKMEEAGELVDQGEICNSKTSEDETLKHIESINEDRKEAILEEGSAKKSEAHKDDAEDSSGKYSLKKDDAVEKEATELAAGAQEREIETTETKNYGVPTEESFESVESSKKLDCTSGVVKKDQSNETILETNLNTLERNIISESVEKSSQESQENQEETEDKRESKLEAEDYIIETQNADETTTAAILTEEVHKEVEKPYFYETVKHLNKEKSDEKELHTVSSEGEREDKVKEFNLASTESLKATDSKELTEKVSSEVQEAQAVEKEISAITEKEEEDREKGVSLSPTIPTKESEGIIKEQNIEDADRGFDKINTTTVAAEVLADDKTLQDSNIPSDESKPHAFEVEASQQHSMVLEENSSSLASRLPPDDHESIKQENATMGNANLDGTEDSGKDSEVIYESRNQSVEELHIDEIREEIKEAAGIVHMFHSDEIVSGIEVATNQTITEEKEYETPSLPMPCKEEEQGIKATIENIGEKIEKLLISKDEMPENSTALEITEDRCLHEEKGEALDRVEKEINEASETALKSKGHNHEVATEAEVSNDNEEKSEEQHQTESGALRSKEHELEYSTKFEKIEESSDSILKSNSRDNGADNDEISSNQNSPMEKPEEQNQTLSSPLLSKEQEDGGTSVKINSTEENKKEIEDLEDNSEAIDELLLQKELSRELEVSLLEFQTDKDAKEESPNEIHDGQVGATNGTKEAIKEVSESALKPSSEDHGEAVEDEIVSGQLLAVDKLEEQNLTASAGLLSEEQAHGISTNTDSTEEKAMEVEVPETAPKRTGGGCITKEESGELKTSQLDLQIDNDIQECPEEIYEPKDGTPDEYLQVQPELGSGIRETEHPPESGEISESETHPYEKTSNLKIEISEECSESASEFHSHKVLTESEETEIKEKHLEAGSLNLIEKENQCAKTTDAAKIIHTVTNDQIMEENDAKNCDEITNGEEGTKENQEDHELKGEESPRVEALTKAKQDEMISTEKETVENLEKAAENMLVEEETEVVHEEHEMKDKEIPGDEKPAKEKQNEEISTEKQTIENLHQGVADNIFGEEATEDIHQEHEIKSGEILGDKVLAAEMQSEVVNMQQGTVDNLNQAVVDNISSKEATKEIHQEDEIKIEQTQGDNEVTNEQLCKNIEKTDADEMIEKDICTEKHTVENLQQAADDNILVEETTEMIHQEHEMQNEEILEDEILVKDKQNEKLCKEIEKTDADEMIEKDISTEKQTVENLQQAAADNILVEETTKMIHQEHVMQNEEILGVEKLLKDKQNEKLCKEIEKTDADETIEKDISTEKQTVENLQQAAADNILVEETTKMIHQEHVMQNEEILGDEILVKDKQNEKEIRKTDSSDTIEQQISTEIRTIEKLHQGVVVDVLCEEATKEIHQEHEIKDREIIGDKVLADEMKREENNASETLQKQISTEKGIIENVQKAVVGIMSSEEATEETHQEHEIKVEESQEDNEVTNEQIMEENDAKNCDEITHDEEGTKESYLDHEIKGEESLEDEALIKETQHETISTAKATVENLQQAAADNLLVEETTKMTHQEYEMKDEQILGVEILAKDKQNKEISTEKGTIENLHQGVVGDILGEEATKEIHQEHEIKGREILGDKVLVEEMKNEVTSIEKGTIENLHQTVAAIISSEQATEVVHQEHEIKVEESQGDNEVTNKQIMEENEAKNGNEITHDEEGTKESHQDHEIKDDEEGTKASPQDHDIKDEDSTRSEALTKATQNETIKTKKETVENLQQAVPDNILVEEATKVIHEEHEMKGEEILTHETLAKETQNKVLCEEIGKIDSSNTIEKQINAEKGTVENLYQGIINNTLDKEATKEIQQQHEIKGEEIPQDKLLAEEMQGEMIITEKGTVETFNQAVDIISSEEATEEIHQQHEIKVEEGLGDNVVINKQIMEENYEEITPHEGGATASHHDNEIRGEESPGDESLTKKSLDEEKSTEKGTAEILQQAIVSQDATKIVYQEIDMKDEEILRDKISVKATQNEVVHEEKETMENIHQDNADNISSAEATKEICQENEINSEEMLREEMQSQLMVKADDISKEEGTDENLHQAVVDNISREKAIEDIHQERSIKSEESPERNEQITEENDARNFDEITHGEEVTKESQQDQEIKDEESLGDEALIKATQNEAIDTEKGTVENLQRADVDNNLVKEETIIIYQEHEMKGEGILGNKILAKETQNEARLNLCKEIGNSDSSNTVEKQINTEKGTIENLHQRADENVSGEEATKEIYHEHEIKSEEFLREKMLAEVIQNEVLHKEIVETDASEMLQKNISTEKGTVENLHQAVLDNISSEAATEDIHQEHEIQIEALHKEIQKTNASETIEKHISTETVIVENLHQVGQNETAEEQFLDETGGRNIQKAERKLNIESQGDKPISTDDRTEASTATEKDLDVDTSRIEVATGIARAFETTKGIHQEKGKSDGILENQSLREVEPETIISTGKKDVPQVLQEPETTKDTEVGASPPVYATDVDPESIRVEHGIENITDERDGKTTEETVSRGSAKLSLFDMMRKSTREWQAAAELAEEKEPIASKEEMEVEKQTEQTEKEKSDEEEEEEEEGEEHKKDESGSDAPVIVDASRDIDIKVAHKKSHNILSGVGSKVKHSISKVKKAITGKSSHPKQQSPK